VDYLADTNVILRFVHRTDPLHATARAAARKLRSQGSRLRSSSQNLVELWNVATRSTAANGLGFAPAATEPLLRLAERIFPVLPDSPAVYGEWRRIVVNYGVSGVKVHDARLVAMMLVCGVTHILTFNTKDFARFSLEGIVVIDPTQV
jgi:predicted nucleic acid-binding protein